MFREYAIDPEAISSWEKFRFLTSLLGWDHGRLITELPSRWKLKVFEAIKCRDVEKQRVQIIMKGWDLIRRKDRIYNLPSWQENAIAEHRRINFEKIIVKESPQIPCAIPIDELGSEHFHEPRQIVNRNAAEMALAVRLLLQTGEIIKLVDPYFDPTDHRYSNTFIEFVRTIVDSPYQRDFSRLEIHTGATGKDEAVHWCDNIKSQIAELTSKFNLCVDICIWNRNIMHNRFIMSDKAGVIWGTGLDEQGDSLKPSDDIFIMSDVQHKQHLAEYSESNTNIAWQHKKIIPRP